MQNQTEFEFAIALIPILALFLPAWGIVIGIFIQILNRVSDRTVLIILPIGVCLGIFISILYVFIWGILWLIDILWTPGIAVNSSPRVLQVIFSLFFLAVLYAILALAVLVLQLYMVLDRRNTIRALTVTTGIFLLVFDFWRFFTSPIVDGAFTFPPLMFVPILVGVVLLIAVSSETYYNRSEKISN